MRCRCDGCGAWKGEGNKWLLGAWFLLPGWMRVGPRFLGFMLWDDDVARADGVLHLCGDACKQKLLGEHLTPPVLVKAPEAEPEALPAAEQAYVPIECEFCGPHCHGGAEHNQRVENGDRYSDGGEL